MRNYDIDIIIKSVLAMFIAYSGIKKNINPIFVVIILLLYISTLYLVKILNSKSKIRNIIYVFQSLILLFILKEGEFLSLSIISIDLFAFLVRRNIYFIQCFIICILGFYLKDYENIEILILTMILVLILIMNNEKDKEKINNLNKLELNQRNKIKDLNNKILKDKEYSEQILRTSILEERNLMSAKLHDKIGHVISGTLLQLEATKIIMEDDRGKAELFIDKSINNLRHGMDDIRMTLRSIRPNKEEISINRLKKLLEEKLSNTRIKGTVNFSGDLDKVTTEMWVLFLNVLIEGSTNAIKYSKCNFFEVNIEVLNKLVKFQIKDDGIGCINIKKGIGITAMEEKVRELDGKFILNGERGFSLIILLNIGGVHEN